MKISRRMQLFLIVITAALAAVTPICRAQRISAVLIEKSLDEPAKINFRNISLEDAFESLRKKLGIPFEVDQTALAQLPYGQLTILSSVQLQGMSWRDALRELLKPLALTFQPGADRIYILGTDELMRQPRRLNIAELDAIVRLQNTNLNNSEKKLLRQIRQLTRTSIFNLIELDERRQEADEDTAEQALSSFPQPASKVLDLYSRRVLPKEYNLKDPGSWYVRAEIRNGRTESIDIIIVPAIKLNLLKLERRINVAFKNQPVQAILQELAHLGAIDIRFEPGCFALLDENLRNNFSLSMRSATIKDALEALSGMTGLAYEVRGDSVYISAGEALLQRVAEQRREAQAANPLACVVIVKLPGTSFETMIFVREEELKKAGVLEKYRRFQQKSISDFIRFLRNNDPPQPDKKK